MAKQNQSGWLRRELYSLLKQYIVPLIVTGVAGVIMTIIALLSELPLMVKIPVVLTTAGLAGIVAAVCLKIVWAFQDRKGQKGYQEVVSFPGKRGKRRRWQEHVQKLIENAPSSGDREESVRWKNEILEMFENFHGSQNEYARMLLKRMAGLEKDADVSECVKKALDYLWDIKDSVF